MSMYDLRVKISNKTRKKWPELTSPWTEENYSVCQIVVISFQTTLQWEFIVVK